MSSWQTSLSLKLLIFQGSGIFEDLSPEPQTLGWTIEVVKHWWINFSRRHLLYGDDMPEIPKGFHIRPRRGVIERTFAWLVTNPRLVVDDEKLPETSETFISMAMSRILMKRLTRPVQT
jgi:putative transposase